MLPVIALVGRPNVGKSTLFNRLTRSRDAIVADFPGLTRDRQYGPGRVGPIPYLVVDTGGFEPVRTEGIVKAMAGQAELAIEEADVVLFICDARTGLTPQDERIAQHLRQSGRKTILVVNKAEGLTSVAAAEFYELGMGEPHLVSAAHGHGIRPLIELALEGFEPEPEEEEDPDAPKRIKVTLAGRPNAGKSTLINALIGEERLIAFDMPGTTRDAIKVDFEYEGRPYEKVFEAIEKFSVVKTLQAIDDSNVVILVIDAKSGIADHDAHIAGYVLDSGRALVVAVNKWDLLDSYEREMFSGELERRLHFLRWARMIRISALKRNGLNHLMKAVDEAHAAAYRKIPTSSRASAAAARPRRSSEAPLCAPGRLESARDRDSRQRPRRHRRELPPLSRELLPRKVQPRGHAPSHRIPHEGKSVREGRKALRRLQNASGASVRHRTRSPRAFPRPEPVGKTRRQVKVLREKVFPCEHGSAQGRLELNEKFAKGLRPSS